LNSLDYINEKFFKLTHPNSEKHSSMDIGARCPVCGDSSKDKSKKRLHLYTKPHWEHDSINCFNCNYSATPYTYFKEYHSTIFPQYKNEIQQLKLNSINPFKVFEDPKEIRDISTDFVVKESTIPKPKILFDCPTSLVDLTPEALEYLKKRNIEPQDSWKYSNSQIDIHGAELKLFNHIIIPFNLGNKWYGFQAVNITKKQYFIYMPNENAGFKIWNFYNINLDETVYIFESIFDALSSGKENCVSTLGITISEEVSNSIKDKVFCFDNQRVDEASLRESEKLLISGNKVMVWPMKSKGFKDFNDLVKGGLNKDKVSKFISMNVYSGLEGRVKLKLG